MKRPVAFLAALLSVASGHAAEEKPAPAITFEELAPPTESGALGASLATAPDGKVWLSWLEAAGLDVHVLRLAAIDAGRKKWMTPVTIMKGTGLFTSFDAVADFPSLTLGKDDRATAVIYWHNAAHNIEHRAAITQTEDGGKTWGEPEPMANSMDSESVALATLADGRTLATWLDGRESMLKPNLEQQLFARVLGESGPEILIDKSVTDFFPPALTAFPDGGALLAYHRRTDDNLTTIRTARFTGHAWEATKPLDNDIGRAGGLRLASDGGRVAAAWFSASNNEPRVLASFSPDAGARFLHPLRIDNGKPAGPVDTLILHDGALVVTWLESDGSMWLRRVTPDFSADQSVRLAPPDATIANPVLRTARPRLALLRDYAGGKTSAQFIVASATSIAAPLRTFLVTVPEGELLDAEKNCECSPTPEQLLGFTMRGTIIAVAASQGTVRVRHDEVPGVLAAGLHEFSVSPDVAAMVAVGRQFLGRIERRDGAWRLFDVRLFIAK
jgi:hypothetical protein